MLNDGEILEALGKSKKLGALGMVHSENGHIIEQVIANDSLHRK